MAEQYRNISLRNSSSSPDVIEVSADVRTFPASGGAWSETKLEGFVFDGKWFQAQPDGSFAEGPPPDWIELSLR